MTVLAKPLATVHALARGERPFAGLLHNCRFEAFGSETYGEEAILARCRASCRPISSDAITFDDPAHLAIFDGGRAWFVDVQNGCFSRLWLLADEEITIFPPEVAISVPFDPDLTQARGDVLMVPADHPALHPDACAKVIALGRRIVASSAARRTRAFVVRAFGTAENGAALLAIFRISVDSANSPGFAMAAACWSSGVDHVVYDRAGEVAAASAPWTPQVGG